MRYLLDTNVCIDVLRGRTDVISRLRELSPDDVFLSSVTEYELRVGALKSANPDRELAKVLHLAGVIPVLSWDGSAAAEAAEVRATLESKGLGIGPYDTLIAGHARSLGATVVSHNLSEFSRVPGLAVETWRQEV